MKLRTAIKIMRHVEEPWRYKTEPRYKRGQIQRAWRRVERQDNKRNWDRRLPYLPTEEELEMRGEIFTQLLLGGSMFGEGILEGLVPDEVLEEARQVIQNLER